MGENTGGIDGVTPLERESSTTVSGCADSVGVISGRNWSSTAGGGDESEFQPFPVAPPSKSDIRKMTLFVSLYLACISLFCIILWVPREGSEWLPRLGFVLVTIAMSFGRVVISSRMLSTANPRLALAFAESDIISIGIISVVWASWPTPPSGYLLTVYSRSILNIFISSAVCAGTVFLSYLVPLALGHLRCASDLLFLGVVAGSLNALYGELLMGSDEQVGDFLTLISRLAWYSILTPLWTCLGTGLVCLIKQKRLSFWFAPLVYLVPLLFEFCYMVALRSFNTWLWLLVAIGFLVISGFTARTMLKSVFDYSLPPFVQGQHIIV